MTKTWKAVVILSLSLNFFSFLAITRMSEAFIDAQRENLGLFLRISGDQQALRRELNQHRAEIVERGQ